MSFHLESIPNRAGKPAILLRQAWREGKRIRKKTIANLSSFPPAVIDGFRTVLKGGLAVLDPSCCISQYSVTISHSATQSMAA